MQKPSSYVPANLPRAVVFCSTGPSAQRGPVRLQVSQAKAAKTNLLWCWYDSRPSHTVILGEDLFDLGVRHLRKAGLKRSQTKECRMKRMLNITFCTVYPLLQSYLVLFCLFWSYPTFCGIVCCFMFLPYICPKLYNIYFNISLLHAVLINEKLDFVLLH